MTQIELFRGGRDTDAGRRPPLSAGVRRQRGAGQLSRSYASYASQFGQVSIPVLVSCGHGRPWA